jgi:hypothetical protein
MVAVGIGLKKVQENRRCIDIKSSMYQNRDGLILFY